MLHRLKYLVSVYLVLKLLLSAKRGEGSMRHDFSLMERDDSYMCTRKSKKYTHLIKTGLWSTAYKLFLLSENINQLWIALKREDSLRSLWTVVSPGYSVRGILQARILKWVAIPFFRGSSWPRDQTQVSCVAGRFFTIWVTRGAPPKKQGYWQDSGGFFQAKA